MIRSASESSVNKMYGEGDRPIEHTLWASKVVFQALSNLGRQYVMRLLFIESAVSSELMAQWVVDTALPLHQDVVDEMRALRILVATPTTTNSSSSSVQDHNLYRLNPFFKQCILHSITSPNQPWSVTGDKSDHTKLPIKSESSMHLKVSQSSTLSISISKQPKAPSALVLDRICELRWDSLLRLLVGAPLVDAAQSHPTATATATTNELDFIVEDVSDFVEYMTKFLRASRLATDELDGWGYKKLVITSKGYEFMLKDFLSQVNYCSMF